MKPFILLVRCVGRTEDLTSCGVIFDPRPDQEADSRRSFWVLMAREEAYLFEIGRLYELTLEGPKADPQ